MAIERVIRETGGVCRTSRLIELGYSQYDINRAARRLTLRRPRRGWIAVQDADPALIFAAQHGVVLTCVTRAQRIGLWVLQANQPHVAAPRGRRVDLPRATIHRRRPLTPRAPGLLEDSLDNTLDCVAHCLPRDEALAVWDSALQLGHTDLQKLSALPWTARARNLLEAATPFSDSGLESFLRARLSWLHIPVRPQVWLFGHRVDFLIGDRLVVQIDGRHHVGTQRSADTQHDAALRHRGFSVLRFTYAEIVYHWPETQTVILDAIARGLHLRSG